jgi:membrane peptidoglycan carboxypeptidase
MSAVRTILSRRQQTTSRGVGLLARSGLVGLTIVALLLGTAGVGAAGLYLEVTARVPAVEDIEGFFDDTGLVAPVLVDRHGTPLLELSHPAARTQLVVGTDDSSEVRAPSHLVQALIITQDPAFWSHPGYLAADWLAAIASDLLGRAAPTRQLTISEQLIAATLLPLDSDQGNPIRRDFRLALLAERLGQRYGKDQILGWYLNALYFGEGIYGVDGASLAYFGKHVDGLSLAESAALAGLVQPALGGQFSPAAIRRNQRATLAAMVQAGLISASQATEARQQPLSLRNPSETTAWAPVSWAQAVVEEARRLMGETALARGGLTLRTTLDATLQSQAECVVRLQAARLAGDELAVAADCPAAELLPALRPGDAQADHAVASVAVVILDPTRGEVLALTGAGAGPAGVGPEDPLLYPFQYLTAFSRGFGPGSMVLDLPVGGTGASGSVLSDDFHGPVLMRRALQRGYAAAASRVTQLAGIENVDRALRELGLAGSEDQALPEGRAAGISPLDLGYAYGVIANDGLMVGRGQGRPAPTTLLAIEDRFDRPYGEFLPSTRVVLGEALAYLLVDVLTDQAAGAELAGGASQLGIEPPAGLIRSGEDGTAWAIGFTPERVVVVRMYSDQAGAERPLTPENGPGPALSALLRFASAGSTGAQWQQPAGVAAVEVCVPSGLLPTVYCPETVEEPFLLGTEPTSFDDLFQPFRVNRETGLLATLATPLDLIEERVYLVPPPEASAWAAEAGLARPPTEYDPLPADLGGDEEVRVNSPAPFALVRGTVDIEGQVRSGGFAYYRLQVGQGLNPSRWIQLGEDQDSRVWRGKLGSWDTTGLNGLYTLQLVVVLDDGGLRTALVPVTIDNEAPALAIRQPVDGAVIEPGSTQVLLVELEASDASGIDRVELMLDGRRVGASDSAPFLFELPVPTGGLHRLVAVATDLAGNQTESSELVFEVAD